MEQPLRFGVSVVTTDGRDVGSLYRVIVDTTSAVVTAITVRRRLLESGDLLKPGGWDRPRDLRVTIDAVTGADEAETRVSLTEEEFLAQPPYTTTEGADPATSQPAGVEAEGIATQVSAALGGNYAAAHDEIENRTPAERHVGHDTRVWDRDPHTHVGDLDAVLMDDVNNRITGLVVRQGVLFSHDVLVPGNYYADLEDDLIHIDIPSGDVHALPPYRGA